MQFEIKKKLVARSEKVKSVDLHPEHDWVLIGLYSGAVMLYDYSSQACLHYVEASDTAVRAVRFIPSLNLFVVGSDDKRLRFYNHNTAEKLHDIEEAHEDFIRTIAVKPFENKVLTGSDDASIHLWSVGDSVTKERSFEEHKKFVMKIAVNPIDTNTFASGSMDGKVKLWSFHVSNSQMTLEGHKAGVNAVAFCPSADKPYLASGSDDRTIIVLF